MTKLRRPKQYSTEVTIRVPAPSTKYLDELFSLRCCGDLAPFFPNAKEVTESFSLFNAVRKVLGAASFGSEETVCLVPGDGSKPRTAALFALRTRWQVKSVDPNMAIRYARNRHGIERLTAHRCGAEALRTVAPHVVIVACHSHAKLSTVLDTVQAEAIDVFSLPCCVKDDIGPPTKTWRDEAVWSPANTMNVYVNVKPGPPPVGEELQMVRFPVVIRGV